MSENPSLGEQFLNDIRPEEFAARAERRFEGAVVEKILSSYDAFTAMKFELDLVRASGVPDTSANATRKELREVTDEFLAHENRDRPDVLEEILAPPLSPGEASS